MEEPTRNGTTNYRLGRLENDVQDVRKAIKDMDEKLDRFVAIVFAVFGTLTVFGLGTAITLLTTRVG